MKKLLLSTLLLALPMLASAYDIAVKNADGVKIYYNYSSDGTELEVATSAYYSGVVNIPEEVTYMSVTRKVTSIGNYVFWGLSRLTSVTIPNSVRSIGNCAFQDCSNLTSVTIGNSVTYIGDHAFSGCTGLNKVITKDIASWFGIFFAHYTSNPLYYAHHLFSDENTEINNLVIPNSVKRIYNYAFTLCPGLTSVAIGDSVTSIGSEAFAGCSSLTSVTIPNSVTYIGDGAFASCTGLTSVTIPNSVTTIREAAFYGCTGLTSVIIPNSVTSIGNHAFQACTSLISVNIGNSVIYIGDWAFQGCSGLTSVTIGNSVITIGDGAFGGCDGLTSVVSRMENPCSTSDYCFSEDVFNNATLYVPNGTKEKYTLKNCWSKFIHIEEGIPIEFMLIYLIDNNTYLYYTLKEGDCIIPETIPTKEGYSFSGWSEIPDTMPAHDVIVTGTFTVNKYKLTYKVDGVEYKSSEVEFGSTITAEENPTKEGYTFSGWSEIPATMPASNVTITGSFTINKYKLTYTLDGEEYKTAEVDYGTALTPEESPTKEGYTFSGWSEIPSTMPAHDVIVTGTFTVNKYTLTYKVDGEEYKISEVDYGTAIIPETAPTKEGYTFSGWSEIPSTMPASDVTITGTFTINTYTITYMVDNALLTTEEVTYGSTITPPASPKEGYEITWNSHPTTMPAYDITIYGSYISTGINGLYAEKSDKKIYTPDGKRVQSPKKGLNIIRKSDGTVKKVVIK